METGDSSKLLALLSKRVRADLALINGLTTSELGKGLVAEEDLLALRLHIRCISLGTEALFIDASIDRINIIRHLQLIFSTLGVLRSGQSTFEHTSSQLLCDARRATLVGLALGDLVWRLEKVSVKLELETECTALCTLNFNSENIHLGQNMDFSRNIIESALGSTLYIHQDLISFSFLL